ncbi:MAG: helix-turn-helix domain-containing protein [Anaerolineales bacterium]|nr:helix-turn-helix domain-containing protein [Anaerolineales bacterium]
MKDELFNELVSSVREGAEILRGEHQPARSFQIEPLEVKEIREQFALSQGQFAALLGVSIKTLQNWEQGRRRPDGAAKVLLQVAAKHPEAVLDVARSMLTETS